MKNMKKILTVVVTALILVSVNSLFAEESNFSNDKAQQDFQKANDYYQNKQFQDAIDTYNKLINNGKETAEVYFNLANSYYKIEDYPSAILNYERAKRANPSMQDVDFNLKLANAHIVDKIQLLPELFLYKWYDNIIGLTNSSGWGIIAVVLMWLSVVLILGFVFLSSPAKKRLSFSLAVLSFLFSIIAFILGANVRNAELSHDDAIIFTESVFIKSSPDQESKNLFLLHSGTKVSIHDELQDWYKIKIADGNDGWIQKSEVVKI